MDEQSGAPGVLAVFDDRDLALTAIRRAKGEGWLRLTAYAPAYDGEIVEAASPPPLLGIGTFAAAAGVAGLCASLAGTIWTTLQWPLLRLGGKPLIEFPPFLVIAGVMVILFAVGATMIMLLWDAVAARPPAGAPYDPRFSDGAFGLWICCPPSHVDAVTRLMRQLGAIECRVA